MVWSGHWGGYGLTGSVGGYGNFVNQSTKSSGYS